MFVQYRSTEPRSPPLKISHDRPLIDGDMDMSGSGEMRMSYSHMTFFWGKDSEILFSGWPGTSGGMYALAMVSVFVLAATVEWLSRRPIGTGRGGAAAAVHAVRVGMAYVLMLAVMSFNVGVLIAAVAGHGVGFLVFGRSSEEDGRRKADPLPCAC